MPPFDDDQVMLCLAGLTYRGFSEGTVGRFHVDLGRRAIAQGLKTLPPLAGKWELVWGPASYRAPLSLLDDELMYVARSLEVRDRYVVAIRGTNPISGFDWVYGDLWTSRQVPWEYDETGESKISLSAALGLNILKGLRSGGPPNDSPASLLGAIEDWLNVVGRATGNLVDQIASRIMPSIASLRHDMSGVIGELVAHRAAQQADDANAHIAAVMALWTSPARAKLLDLIDKAAAKTDGRLDLAVLGLLESESRLRASLGGGIDLRGFLGAAVNAAGGNDVEVVVTGHSKGGGLASTVALWLAETQGGAVPEAERWDPDDRATIHCYSYAGPTAGNAAFAERSNERIGANCHRIMNKLDIVPHAWAVGDLGLIAKLYKADVVAPLPAMSDLSETIVSLTRSLDYTQVGNIVRELDGKLDPDQPLFFHQMVHQHMDAYLEELKLTADAKITTATFFDPLATLPR